MGENRLFVTKNVLCKTITGCEVPLITMTDKSFE